MPKGQGSIWKHKSTKTKKANKIPKFDHFAEKKIQKDQHLLNAMDNIQLLLKTQSEESTKCSTNTNSIESDYFTVIYDKLAQMSAPDVDKSFIEVLEILDEFQKLE